jgi:hypothetical protein
MSITVRPAAEADAVVACDVLRRSIRELCVADHGHDEQVLSAWLANKTPENVRAWITSASSFAVVAVDGSEVRGFGLAQRDVRFRCATWSRKCSTVVPASSCCVLLRNKLLGGV